MEWLGHEQLKHGTWIPEGWDIANISEHTYGEKQLDIGHCGWFVRYRFQDYWMDFLAYEGITKNDTTGEIEYSPYEKDDRYAYTSDLNKAGPQITGYVKWDGCCEIYNKRNNGEHFCGRTNLEEYTKVILAVFDLAVETIPHFARDIGL